MQKTILIAFLSFLLCSFSAFEMHKFYMAIFQVNYAPEKKMLQVTSRIFIDDLNQACLLYTSDAADDAPRV